VRKDRSATEDDLRTRKYTIPYRYLPLPKRPIERGELWTLDDKELRVWLYIVFKTYGFKKHEDAISRTQIANGIRKRDGSIKQSGVMYWPRNSQKMAEMSIATVDRTLRSLRKKGWIITHRHGPNPSTFEPIFPFIEEEKLYEKIRQRRDSLKAPKTPERPVRVGMHTRSRIEEGAA
jgi:hypothetical protein